MIRLLSLRHIVIAALCFVAVLFAIGWATRQDPGEKPYLNIVGGGFISNYRVADVFYGFTAVVQRPLPTGSIIEADFDNPSGGAPFKVSTRVGTETETYSLRSPSVHGVVKDKVYNVAITVRDRDQSRVLWHQVVPFKAAIGEDVVPTKPLTIGPGYARNPQLD